MRYCHQCGSKVNEEDVFCSHCGTRLQRLEEKPIQSTEEKPIQNQEEKPTQSSVARERQEVQPEESKGPGCGCFVLSVILVIVVIVVGIAIANPQLFKDIGKEAYEELIPRKANNGDVYLDYDYNLSKLAIDMIISPQNDIKDLEITIKYYDSSNNLIKKQVEKIGDVREGVQIRRSISILNFNVTELFKINSISVSVTDGRVNI